LLAEARWEGFPGRLHSAILYMALIEAMNWALFAQTERMGLPTRTGALEAARPVRTGTRLRLEGRVLVADATARTARVDARAWDPSDEVVARLERDYALVDQPTFLAKMGYDRIPPGYEGLFR
jgi:acyl dehydratase